MLFTVPPAVSQERELFKPRLSIKLTKGWGPDLRIGDMNTHLESINNMETFAYLREYYPDLISGEIKTLDGDIPDWHLEFRLDVSRRFSLALGTSMPFQKSNESVIDWAQTLDQRDIYTIRTKIQSLPPVIWSAYYGLFPDSRLNVLLNVGAGLYLMKMSEYYNIEIILLPQEPLWWRRSLETRACGAIGIHAGIELDFDVTKSITLVAEAQWRYARIRRFYGYQLDETVFGMHEEYRGNIYYYTRDDNFTGNRYEDLGVFCGAIYFPFGERPSGMDLSRYSFRIGIRIKLF